MESGLAKECRWNRERETMQKTKTDLNDIVKVLRKAKFVWTSQKSAKKIQLIEDNEIIINL